MVLGQSHLDYPSDSKLDYVQLAYGETPLTHTSLQPNVAVYSFPQSKKTIRLVDIPGHPRLRDQFQNHITNAKAIAFVVDANSISRNGAAIAELVDLTLPVSDQSVDTSIPVQTPSSRLTRDNLITPIPITSPSHISAQSGSLENSFHYPR